MLIVIIGRNDAIFDAVLFFIRRQRLKLQVLPSLAIHLDQLVDSRREFTVVDFIKGGSIADGAACTLASCAVLVADVNFGTAKDAKTKMIETQINISNIEKPFRIVMIRLLSRSNDGRGHIEQRQEQRKHQKSHKDADNDQDKGPQPALQTGCPPPKAAVIINGNGR